MFDEFTLPRRGFIFVSEGESAPPVALTNFSVEDPETTPDGWVWLGSTSEKQRFSLEQLEGVTDPTLFDGEVENLCSRPLFLKFTFGGLWGSEKTVGEILKAPDIQSLGGWVFSSEVVYARKSVTVMMADNDGGLFGWYFGRAKLQGNLTGEHEEDYFTGFSVIGHVLKPMGQDPRVLKFYKQGVPAHG